MTAKEALNITLNASFREEAKYSLEEIDDKIRSAAKNKQYSVVVYLSSNQEIIYKERGFDVCDVTILSPVSVGKFIVSSEISWNKKEVKP